MPYSDFGANSDGRSRSRSAAPRASRTYTQSSFVHDEAPRSNRLMHAGYGSDSRRQRNLPYKSHRNARTMLGSDAGMNVHRTRGKRRRRSVFYGFSGGHNNPRSRIILACAVLILIVALVLIGSCVRGCSASQKTASEQNSTNPYDERVAAQASEHLTSELTPVLNKAEKLTWIAQHADRYNDERIVELATLEDASINYVASVPDSEHKALEYSDAAEQGTFPFVYTWDTRWGYVEFANSLMGVTGSGPCALFMARAGLLGTADMQPATIAEKISEAEGTDETLGTSATYFEAHAQDFGLSIKEYTVSSDNIYLALTEGTRTAVLIQLKEQFSSPYAHWALLTGPNEDGSITLHDPLSEQASTHSWALGTIAAQADVLYRLTPAQQANS